MATTRRIVLRHATGDCKKTSLNEFSNVRKGGIIAITIDPGDTLIEVKLTHGSIVEKDEVKDPGDDVVLITRDGMSIRFSESDVRSMGRSAAGVKGITLEKAIKSSRWPWLFRTRRSWWPGKTALANAPRSMSIWFRLKAELASSPAAERDA